MSEDDTFRKLKRLPYKDVLGLFMSLPLLEREKVLVNEETREVFF